MEFNKRTAKQTISVFKKTSNYWHGNYEGNLVQINFTKLYPDDVFVKLPDMADSIFGYGVSATGNDDFAIMKIFRSELDAFNCFLDVIKLDDVTIEILEKMGFEIH